MARQKRSVLGLAIRDSRRSIAGEVKEVLPEVVAREDGKAKGVSYANLVAVLVEAVKEQQKTIEDQRQVIQNERTANEEQWAELNILKAKMDKLEALLQAK